MASAPRESRSARPAELEDWLNRRIYHPLAARLARALLPTGATPNMVSVAGALAVWAAAFAYTALAWPLSAALGFLCHASWHVVDGADGDLARLTGKTSPYGELVDGLCDYAGHVVLYVALAALLDDALGGLAWLLASASGAAHLVQANHAESQRRTYLWWGYGIPWLAQAERADDEVFHQRTWLTQVFGSPARFYLYAARLMNPGAAAVEAALAREADDPAGLDTLRAIVRGDARASLAYGKLLGPNPRTLLLGASMALGTPLWFFLAESVALTGLLVLSVRYHARHNRLLAERLRQARRR